VRLIADRIYQRSNGNPRASMELAQYLVRNHTIRHDASGWVLPRKLDAEQLPATQKDMVATRVRQLSEDALQLGQALALARGPFPVLQCFSLLTEHREASRVYAALDELVFTQAMSCDGDRYAFTQPAWCHAFIDTLDEEFTSLLHRRLAEAYTESHAQGYCIAYHF
jgi:predicted ATPase